MPLTQAGANQIADNINELVGIDIDPDPQKSRFFLADGTEVIYSRAIVPEPEKSIKKLKRYIRLK